MCIGLASAHAHPPSILHAHNSALPCPAVLEISLSRPGSHRSTATVILEAATMRTAWAIYSVFSAAMMSNAVFGYGSTVYVRSCDELPPGELKMSGMITFVGNIWCLEPRVRGFCLGRVAPTAAAILVEAPTHSVAQIPLCTRLCYGLIYISPVSCLLFTSANWFLVPCLSTMTAGQ